MCKSIIIYQGYSYMYYYSYKAVLTVFNSEMGLLSSFIEEMGNLLFSESRLTKAFYKVAMSYGGCNKILIDNELRCRLLTIVVLFKILNPLLSIIKVLCPIFHLSLKDL